MKKLIRAFRIILQAAFGVHSPGLLGRRIRVSDIWRSPNWD